MLKWLFHRKLNAFEREHGYDASYMHAVLDTDVGGYVKFARATGLGRYRKDVPADVYVAATLASSIQADCGPCSGRPDVRFRSGRHGWFPPASVDVRRRRNVVSSPSRHNGGRVPEGRAI